MYRCCTPGGRCREGHAKDVCKRRMEMQDELRQYPRVTHTGFSSVGDPSEIRIPQPSDTYVESPDRVDGSQVSQDEGDCCSCTSCTCTTPDSPLDLADPCDSCPNWSLRCGCCGAKDLSRLDKIDEDSYARFGD